MNEELLVALVKALVPQQQVSQPAHDFGSLHKIVVCQRGFVYAGEVAKHGDYIVITNAVNLRRWGTTKGLGQLAEHGSTPETKADHVGTVRVHELAVVSMIDCTGPIDVTA